jgi:hypothetical protein
MQHSSFPLSEKTRNLVRFCRHAACDVLDEAFQADFGFRDAGSHFSILKNVQTAPGPDECFCLHELDARLMFAKLLGLELDFPELADDQRPKLALYGTMNYYRSHIEEFFCVNGVTPLPPVEGQCDCLFDGPDRLLVRYRLQNRSATAVTLRARWSSQPADELTDVQGAPTVHGFLCTGTQQVFAPYQVAAHVVSDAGDLTFRYAEGRFISDWIERTLPAGTSLTVTFTVAFAVNGVPAVPKPREEVEELFLAARMADEAAYARLPELPAAFAAFEPLVLKAVGTLRTLRYVDRTPSGRDVLTIHAGKSGCAATWFWDGAFSLLGLGIAGDRETAQGMSHLLLEGIDADGVPPCTYQGGQYKLRYQQPILAWGIGQYEALCPDDGFLRECYEPLGRYVRHWLTAQAVAGTGLVRYPAGGTCWDDGLRWQDRFPVAPPPGDAWAHREWGRMQLDAFLSVDTNTHLYLECRALAGMARRLGFAGEATGWEEAATTLAQAINATLYNADAGIYGDRCIADGRFTEMLTPACFLPIYAGIAPPDVAVRLCRDYLLNPERFYTTLPFPSLDRAHPAFRSGGWLYAPPAYPGALVQQAYWIGRTWPHVSYWMVGALHQAGLHSEAEDAAGRILDAMSRSEVINECYDPLTGFGNGHGEFMWSAAAVLALAYRLYAREEQTRR